MDAVRRNYARLSLLCGAAAAVLSWHALSSARETGPPAENAFVLVFASDATEGTLLKPGAVRWSAWPAPAVTAGMVRRATDAEADFDPVLLPASFRAGDPVPASLVVEKGGQPLVRPGMRLIAVRLREDSIASFLRAGMHIDLHFAGPRPVVLKNVRLAGVRRHGDGPSVRERAALLLVEVSPRQAAHAAGGLAGGEVSVALASATLGRDADHASPREEARDGPITLVKYGALAGGRAPQAE